MKRRQLHQAALWRVFFGVSDRLPWLMLCATLVLVGCNGKSDNQKLSGAGAVKVEAIIEVGRQLPLPARPESPFLNTHPDVQYVGSETCQSCHDDVHANFFRTRHSQAMSEISRDESKDGSIRHEKSGFEYDARWSKDGRLIHSEAVLVDGNPHDAKEVLIDYAIGSGRFGKSYLSKLDGFLVQSPLTWYSDRKEWGMSPGYDFAGQFSFKRAVSAGCLYCHAGNLDVIDDNEYHTVIHEQFVSCERCHGPGQLHVEKHQAGSAATTDTAAATESEIDYSIVNPSRLDRQLQEAICQQCHLQSDASIEVRGCDFNDFRPGLPLSSFRQDFRYGKSDDGMTIVGHVEQMHRSPCFQQTETLTCTTCHHPHAEEASIAPLDVFRNTCLKCHTDNSCGESLQIRTTKAQNHCTICHMPSSPTEVPHVAFTHHRIGIHSTDPKITETDMQASSQVIGMGFGDDLPGADRARVLGLAALMIFQTKPNAMNNDVLKLAREQLQKAWDAGAADADVAAGLTNIAEIVGFPDMIDKWGTATLEMEDGPSEARATALKILSELRFRQGNYAESYELLKELTNIRRDSRAWFFRGLAAQNLDKTDDAIDSLLKSVNIDPRSQAAHSALGALFHAKNDSVKSEYHRQMAKGLAPSAK